MTLLHLLHLICINHHTFLARIYFTSVSYLLLPLLSHLSESALHSLVIASCYSYLSPCFWVLLLPGGGGWTCLALMNPCRLSKTPTLI